MALTLAMNPSTEKKSVKRRRVPTPLYREMDYQKISTSRTEENEAVVRFYAMMNIMVTFKGRSTYEIDPNVMEIKIKQSLEVAFLKLFQAMLNYPSNMSLRELVEFTCHGVLFEEIERLHEELGLKKRLLPGMRLDKDGKSEKLTVYQKKARECRMKIFEDTISRFYSMLEIYTPYKMRPRLWDEQSIPDDYMNERIKLPIREAFKTFIVVMRQFPTKITKQKDLVDYTLGTILPNCEAGMSERGIRYHLTHGKEKGQRRQHVQKDSQSRERSVWDRDDDDIKIALGYQRMALRLPSHSAESKQAATMYSDIMNRASHGSLVNTAQPPAVKTKPSPSNKSQLQSLIENKKPCKPEDYSWIQPIGAQVRRMPSPVFGRHHRRGTKVSSTVVLKTQTAVKYEPTSSSNILLVPTENDIIQTEAISYRQVLSPKQKQKLRENEYEDLDATMQDSTLGYPIVYSRRRREVKSAPIYDRKLLRHLSTLSSVTIPAHRSGTIYLQENINPNYDLKELENL